jgi:hypothetical protein
MRRRAKSATEQVEAKPLSPARQEEQHALLDHLVRPQEERLRDRQPERFRGLEVDDQFELRGLLDGKVSGLGALEDSAHQREELARIETETTRRAQAIAAGGTLPGLVAAMQERERPEPRGEGLVPGPRRQLPGELDARESAARREDRRDADWRSLLRQETGPARQALASLLAGRLVFTPRECPDGRFYEFEGPGTVSKVIAGFALPRGLVTR